MVYLQKRCSNCDTPIPFTVSRSKHKNEIQFSIELSTTCLDSYRNLACCLPGNFIDISFFLSHIYGKYHAYPRRSPQTHVGSRVYLTIHRSHRAVLHCTSLFYCLAHLSASYSHVGIQHFASITHVSAQQFRLNRR